MNEQIKRKNIRFKPDQNTLVKLKTKKGNELVGLAFSEAYSGCGGFFVILDEKIIINEKEICQLQVGEISYQSAQIRWIEKYDHNLIKIGFEIIN